jgi:hypothetical protein
MMAFPSRASNQKMANSLWKSEPNRHQNAGVPRIFFQLQALSLFLAAVLVAVAQEEPPGGEEHAREELGVNPYTAPSIPKIFQQLDELRPLPFNRLKRDFPQPAAAGREQRGLIFGGLIADGFLIVATERKNLVENLGRFLIQEARSLGVADQVMRHSASLTDLGRRGDWKRVRAELITTQADVEQAMIDLRDEKLAHLISLGGWLRGLEICAGAVESDFSPQRVQVLAQPDLVNYFNEELKTLPPRIAHAPLFDKIRSGVEALRPVLNKSPDALTPADVHGIYTRAHELNTAIRQNE